MKTFLTGAIAFWIAAAARAESTMFNPGPDNNIHQKGVVTVQVPWIKDKGKKFDVHLSIHNENPDKGMIIFLSDMGCRRGKVTGELKHTFFNTGEKTIDFKPNQTKDFNLVCRTEGATRGDFKLSINKVYNNPSLDGKTVGKVIAENLTWSQDDRRN